MRSTFWGLGGVGRQNTVPGGTHAPAGSRGGRGLGKGDPWGLESVSCAVKSAAFRAGGEEPGKGEGTAGSATGVGGRNDWGRRGQQEETGWEREWASGSGGDLWPLLLGRRREAEEGLVLSVGGGAVRRTAAQRFGLARRGRGQRSRRTGEQKGLRPPRKARASAWARARRSAGGESRAAGLCGNLGDLWV